MSDLNEVRKYLAEASKARAAQSNDARIRGGSLLAQADTLARESEALASASNIIDTALRDTPEATTGGYGDTGFSGYAQVGVLGGVGVEAATFSNQTNADLQGGGYNMDPTQKPAAPQFRRR